MRKFNQFLFNCRWQNATLHFNISLILFLFLRKQFELHYSSVYFKRKHYIYIF